MKILRGLISFVVMVAVLFSGMGFTVSQHYCMGHLKTEQFFGKASGCLSHDGCEDPVQSSLTSDSCCSNVELSIEGLQILSLLEDVQPDLQISIFVESAPLPFAEDWHDDALAVQYSGKDPPRAKPGRQILVQVQRFLI